MDKNNTSDLQKFFIWCAYNKISVKLNNESFLINEYTVMKPEFIINQKIFVDLLYLSEMTDEYIENCKAFAKSFGHIILFPRESMSDLHLITKHDIKQKYGVRL